MTSGGVVPCRQKTQVGFAMTAVICAIAAANGDVGLEINLDHSDAVERLRFYVVYIVDGRGQRSFRQGDDARGHVYSRKTLVLPHDADHGNIDVGKYVDRRVQDGERPQDQQ